MKTKTEAAKVLFDAGWTFQEVQEVLEGGETLTYPMPYPVYPQSPYPAPYKLTDGTDCTDGVTITYTSTEAQQ